VWEAGLPRGVVLMAAGYGGEYATINSYQPRDATQTVRLVHLSARLPRFQNDRLGTSYSGFAGAVPAGGVEAGSPSSAPLTERPYMEKRVAAASATPEIPGQAPPRRSGDLWREKRNSSQAPRGSDLAALVAWFAIVRDDWVRDAGDQFAQALLACCDTLDVPSAVKACAAASGKRTPKTPTVEAQMGSPRARGGD
jgi:hypothetical protein